MNPLGVTMGFRDFKLCRYWLSQINAIDRLEINNYEHGEAHLIARDFFLSNPQYSHFLFLCEDNVVTPSHLKLILEDALQFKDAVVCGYSNVQWTKDEANISFRNMRNLVVGGREVYQHPHIESLITGQNGFPFVKVWFNGTTLMCIQRSVVEKLSFKPYRFMRPEDAFRLFKVKRQWGIMQDFQLCRELDVLGVPIICDLRLFLPHFTQAPTSWNFKGKPRTVILHHKDGKTEKIREDAPYQ
jgi:hypothetical protein